MNPKPGHRHEITSQPKIVQMYKLLTSQQDCMHVEVNKEIFHQVDDQVFYCFLQMMPSEKLTHQEQTAFPKLQYDYEPTRYYSKYDLKNYLTQITFHMHFYQKTYIVSIQRSGYRQICLAYGTNKMLSLSLEQHQLGSIVDAFRIDLLCQQFLVRLPLWLGDFRQVSVRAMVRLRFIFYVQHCTFHQSYVSRQSSSRQ